MGGKGNLGLGLRTEQRLALFGRLRMAEWIEMPEGEFARHVEDIEKDPLFRKLFFASPAARVISRQRWPGGGMSAGFYAFDEGRAAGSEPVQVEGALESRAGLVELIRKMGQEAFEKYFLYGAESAPLEEIARKTKLSLEEVRSVHDLLLEIGAQAEFHVPNPEPASRSTCLARITADDGEPRYEFFSPYWARGLYQVRYDLLEQWKRGDLLSGEERKRLRHLLKRIEIVNLRQSTVFRILETLTKLHTGYLRSHQEDQKRPLSLRMLARRLDLAPSTVSRALSGRSVRLPWGEEVPLIRLTPGRRNILREILGRWMAKGEPAETDAALTRKLREEYGISVSRRTVNAVRNEILARRPAEPRPRARG